MYAYRPKPIYEETKEGIFYLTTHSAQFIYSYLALDRETNHIDSVTM